MGRHGWLLMGLCGILFSQGAWTNDLLTAYREAQHRDAVLQAASAQLAGAEELVPQARAAFLPQLLSQGSTTHERQVYAIGSTNLTGTSLSSAAGNVSTFNITVGQPMWDLAGLRRLKQAHSQVEQARLVYRNAAQNLILRVAQAYFAIQSAADQLDTLKSQRQAFQELLRQAQVREQQGLSTHTDVAEAESFFDTTEQPIIDAENDLEDAKRGLAEITGSYPPSVAPLREDVPLLRPEPDSAQEWAEGARHDNLDVQAAALGVDVAERDVGVQRAKYWPTLSLQGSVAHTTEPDAFGGNQEIEGVGLQLSWPLYQGGTVQSLVRQSMATLNQAKAQLDITQRHVERMVSLAFRSVQTGVARVQAAKRAVESGRIAVEASRRGVEFATRTEFDLLNQQNNYYSAVRIYRQSRYAYLTAVLQLKQLANRLQEADLVSLDELLAVGPESQTP